MTEASPVTVSEVLGQHGVGVRLANHLGVGRTTVYDWLSGRAVPSGPSLVALTDYLRRYVPTATEREVLDELARRRGTRAGNGSRQPETVGAQEGVAS